MMLIKDQLKQLLGNERTMNALETCAMQNGESGFLACESREDVVLGGIVFKRLSKHREGVDYSDKAGGEAQAREFLASCSQQAYEEMLTFCRAYSAHEQRKIPGSSLLALIKWDVHEVDKGVRWDLQESFPGSEEKKEGFAEWIVRSPSLYDCYQLNALRRLHPKVVLVRVEEYQGGSGEARVRVMQQTGGYMPRERLEGVMAESVLSRWVPGMECREMYKQLSGVVFLDERSVSLWEKEV